MIAMVPVPELESRILLLGGTKYVKTPCWVFTVLSPIVKVPVLLFETDPLSVTGVAFMSDRSCTVPICPPVRDRVQLIEMV